MSLLDCQVAGRVRVEWVFPDRQHTNCFERTFGGLIKIGTEFCWPISFRDSVWPEKVIANDIRPGITIHIGKDHRLKSAEQLLSRLKTSIPVAEKLPNTRIRRPVAVAGSVYEDIQLAVTIEVPGINAVNVSCRVCKGNASAT